MNRAEIRAELESMGYPLANRDNISMETLLMSRTLRLAWYSKASPSQRDRANMLKVMEHELLQREDEAEKAKQFADQVNEALKAGGVGERTRDVLRAGVRPTFAFGAARAWYAETDRKTWLVLRGPSGRGKTVAAAWVLEQFARQGRTVRCVDAPVLAQLAPYGEGKKLFTQLLTVDVLMVDDFGKESLGDIPQGQLFRLFEKRHEAYRSTIITTNLDGKSLGERLGTIANRIKDDGITKEVEGGDLRLAQGSLV